MVLDDNKAVTDSQSVHSESDNEIVQDENLNLDDEFEKIVPSKIDDLEEIAVTDEDLEIVEILSAGEKSNVDDAIRTNINIAAAATEVEENEEIENKIQSDTLENVKIDREEEKVAEISAEKLTEELTNEKNSGLSEENIEIALESTENKIELEVSENLQDQVEPEKLLEVGNITNDEVTSQDTTDNVTSSIELHEEISKINEKSKETIIDEDLLPRETILKIIAESSAEHSKPAIPLQTYLWEDVKRAKEQVSNDQVCVIPLLCASFVNAVTKNNLGMEKWLNLNTFVNNNCTENSLIEFCTSLIPKHNPTSFQP